MDAVVAFFSSALRLGTPLSYAALGGYCSERSGTINIALEGLMLMGAFTAAAVAHVTHNPWLGVLGGAAGAMCLAAVHGLLCIRFGADQIISGIAVNLLAAGVPPVACKAFFGSAGGTPLLAEADQVPSLLGVSPLGTGAFLACAAFILIHRQTRLGQYLRFAGEHPEALESQGVDVARVRWQGVLLSGLLCGLAGAYLSIDHGSGFARNMTSGRGFIALAALILGRWTPGGAFASALVFGAIESCQILMQGLKLPNGQSVPVQWIQMLPYAATLLILASAVGGRFGRARAPRALGVPLAGALFALTSLSGCTPTDDAVRFFNEKIAPKIGYRIEKPAAPGKPAAPNGPTGTPVPAGSERMQAHGEFLREVFKTVLGRDLHNAEEFTRYLNVLEQGGHLEGIYNGLVYSDEYREREKGPGASVTALKIYSGIMARLMLDQKYDIARPGKPEEKPDVPKQVETPVPAPTEAERKALVAQIEAQDFALSAFALKRRLGEEVLKTIDLKREYREKLATWYGAFTAALNRMGVGFGLEQRNNPNEYYHYKWALEADEDRLRWECLNRVHAVMNHGMVR